ncbi:phage major capsid protein [Burkholderia cenocepacia]|uniref:phage major capsid protein n=1 Tax=Burkholderia cenocepacia TaxID=95486 RepID=UPI000B6DF679|nr:phage major capsid protein [Burkholderia cenocepacia]MBR8157128.1 phage major capsid protein [Burkholderia cenocepacia]OUE48271.1 3-phosphoglycerate kinase [Burkholderia territorii]HDR9497596.1 phage major capsid protein [Burkholderia cepacia]
MGLQNPSSTLTEIVTTTLRNRTGKLADNVTKNNALLYRLRRRGNVKTVSGGRTIVQELEYAENGTFKRYSGYEALNISPSDVFTGAEFNYAQAAVAVSISGLEQLQNSGEDAIIDLLESRIKNAEKTLVNNIALDCYSDGTADGGRQIGGLQLLVSATPTTGVVGGIDASTSIGSFWRNTAFSAVTNGGGAATSANIQSYMNRVYVQQVRGTDRPDLIIADNNYFRLYLESLQAIQRITSNEMGEAGFDSLKYMSSDVVLDGGFGGGAPTNTMFFLNTDYIYFRPHTDRNFAPIGDDRFAVNQDAMVKLVGFAGNMTVSNRRLQAVLTA